MCAVPSCRGEVELIYLGHGVCLHCWDELAGDFSRLRVVLGIGSATDKEDAMNMSETNTTAAENAAEEATVPTKTKATKKTKTSKAKTKLAKAPKPKKEKAPKEPKPGRVFAFRCTTPELEAIHKTAGDRNASRLIRAVANAFANEDEGAFKAALMEARQLR